MKINIIILSVFILGMVFTSSCTQKTTEPSEVEEEYEYTIVDGNFVDPSMISDSNTGELILFYLPGIIGSNPAGCDNYPCTKYIRSAVTQLSNDSMYVIILQAATH